MNFRGGGASGNKLLNRKNKGFTIAEVLITLGIIGIVAAMTFPSMLGNYRKKVVENKLKVTYSMISQALQKVQGIYGLDFVPDELFSTYDTADVNGYSWDLSRDVFEHYFAQHFNIVKRYPTKNDSSIMLAGASKDAAAQLQNIHYAVTLNNGVTLGYQQQYQSNVHSSMTWFVMLKPITKRDNKFIEGKDVFIFRVERSNWNATGNMILTVKDYPELSRDKIKEYCTSSSAFPYDYHVRAYFCTLLIFKNGMEIPDDYPVRF